MTKRSKTATALLVVIVLLLTLAGCATTPSPPLGTYTTTITQDEHYSSAGPWELTLAEGNRYSWSHNGRVVDEGQCVITQDQIVFTYEDGPYRCFEQDVYTYTWSFDGEALTLTPVEEGCLLRKLFITIHPWSRQD